ncbi:MAG: aldo/keto reductase [Ruoffia tabacinasalis]|uniref:aldo/keto reductase n=1 Tax=unclassified Ruoffia TaxID=2862149 RepID=UPI000ED1B629|nr:2,5-diketo-D-gluconic acid reductase [Aerococcaceae bacterium]
MTQLKEVFTFSNGLEIPAIGLGTWQMSPEEAEQMTAYALNNGYIHIDTARTYGNEEGVGKGMKASGVNREDFFLTTKVSAFSKTYDEAKKDIEDSLTALDTEYLDLVIIHAPRPWDKMHSDGPIERLYFEENLQVWRALEEAYEAGKVKAIGVSNFEIDDLVKLLVNVKIKPMLNQIKYHIGFRDEQLVQYCQENDIIVEAYSPIGTGKLLNNPDIQTIADKYNKSTAQIAIRYCYQKDLVVLPKSVHEEYVDNNADLDFEILATDMDYLNRLVIN